MRPELLVELKRYLRSSFDVQVAKQFDIYTMRITDLRTGTYRYIQFDEGYIRNVYTHNFITYIRLNIPDIFLMIATEMAKKQLQDILNNKFISGELFS